MTRKNLATFACFAALAACLTIGTAAAETPSTDAMSPDAALAELDAQHDAVEQLITIQKPYVQALKSLYDQTGDDYVWLIYAKANAQLQVFNLKLAQFELEMAEIEVGDSSDVDPSVSDMPQSSVESFSADSMSSARASRKSGPRDERDSGIGATPRCEERHLEEIISTTAGRK